MPDTSYEEIRRRHKENDPIEVRVIPHTGGLTLRVLGYVMGGHPVLHGDDDRAYWEWVEKQYKCHWCRDTRRVFTHGEHLLTAKERQDRNIVGDPCPKCSNT